MNGEEAKKVRPLQVKTATSLLWGSLAAGTVISALDSGQLLAMPSALGWAIAITLAVFALIAVLVYQIGQGRNWARITLLVLCLISLLPYLPNLHALFGRSILLGTVSLAQLGMQLVALYLIFTNPGAAWFRKAA